MHEAGKCASCCVTEEHVSRDRVEQMSIYSYQQRRLFSYSLCCLDGSRAIAFQRSLVACVTANAAGTSIIEHVKARNLRGCERAVIARLGMERTRDNERSFPYRRTLGQNQ